MLILYHNRCLQTLCYQECCVPANYYSLEQMFVGILTNMKPTCGVVISYVAMVFIKDVKILAPKTKQTGRDSYSSTTLHTHQVLQICVLV